MKKLMVLGLALACSFSANANYIKIKASDGFPAEAYKTIKPVQVQYEIYYSNTFEEDENTEFYPEPNKNGLYVNSFMKLKTLPSESFPETNPSITSDLAKILKLSEETVVQKFKGVSKKKPYICVVSGQMHAQFTLHYDGRDAFRFSQSVTSDVKAATQIGKPVIKCHQTV